MAKNGRLTQQQVLNIVILVISALVLMFVMVGRLMDKPSPEPHTTEVAKVTLQRIDFGEFDISRVADGWQSSHSNISAQQAADIAKRWQSLMNQSAEPLMTNAGPGKMVLLYFSNLSGPVTAKISRNDLGIRISFLSSGQQLVLAGQDPDDYFPRIN